MSAPETDTRKKPTDPAPAAPPMREPWRVAVRHSPLKPAHARYVTGPVAGPLAAWQEYLAWLAGQITVENYKPMAPLDERRIPPTHQPLTLARNFLADLQKHHARTPPPGTELLPERLVMKRFEAAQAKTESRGDWKSVEAEIAATRAAYADQLG